MGMKEYAKEVAELREQNQKLIEALEEIANDRNKLHAKSHLREIAQQALDEVNGSE